MVSEDSTTEAEMGTEKDPGIGGIEALSEEHYDLFEKPIFAHFATLLPSGLPHVTPLWIDYDTEDDRLLVNTERGRQKERNVQRNPNVGLSMTDPDNSYRYLHAIGKVDEITTEGAREHLDELAHRYVGEDYPNPIATERVLLRIRPHKIDVVNIG